MGRGKRERRKIKGENEKKMGIKEGRFGNKMGKYREKRGREIGGLLDLLELIGLVRNH